MALELKLSCLNLVEQGSIGLMGAIVHLRWLLLEVKEREDRSAVIQEAANTFMEVQRAIMKELMRSYDLVADQTILIKFLSLFVSKMDCSTPMQSFFIRCKETNSGKYSIEEVKQIMGLWRQLSYSLIRCRFWCFFKFLLDVCLCFSTWQKLLSECMSFGPADSAIAVRWHLPTLRMFTLWYPPSDIPLGYYNIQYIPRIMIQSTTYLVNCWCLLDQADFAVASKIIKEKVTYLLDNIYWLIASKTWKDERIHHAGLGRLLRCITSTIIKKPNSAMITKLLTCFLKKYIAATKRQFSVACSRHDRVNKIVDVFRLLSRTEMGTFQDNLQRLMRILSEAGHIWYKHEDIMAEMEKIMQIEDNLPSLSREDADIAFLPDHVNKAIDSLRPEAATFIPEVGVFTLLHRNINRLPSLEWARDIMLLFNRAAEVEPILREILK